MISIIIPFYNEENQLEKTLAPLIPYFDKLEIIAVNGKSTDQSKEILEKYPNIKILDSAQGRAIQMNKGVAIAQGEIFLFLHADTVLGEGWYQALIDTDHEFQAGAFSLGTDQNNWFIYLVKIFTFIRTKLGLHTAYGDQAIWVRKDAFEMLSGYKEIPIMEEVDLIDRLKKITKIKILSVQAYTSIRRWQEEGQIRATIKNISALLLYRMKVDYSTIRKIYNSDTYPWDKRFKF